MRAMRILGILLTGLIFAFLPLSAAAQSTSNDDNDVLVRVNGDYQLPAGQTNDTVIVGSGDANIAGTVNSFLMVIDGTATVTGRVDGDIVVIRGTLRLEPGATVKDVTLVRSTLVRDPAAVVTGDINERSGYSFGWGTAIFSILFWIGSTIVVLVAGLLFAAIGSRQLIGAALNATERVGESVLAAIVVWIGLPILAVITFVSLIGIPIGLAIIFILLPALGFLGYIVIGARIGMLIFKPGTPPDPNRKPYLATVVGLLILQVIALIPFFGGFVAFISALYGAGALAYYAFQGWRGRRVTVTGEGPQPVPATS